MVFITLCHRMGINANIAPRNAKTLSAMPFDDRCVKQVAAVWHFIYLHSGTMQIVLSLENNHLTMIPISVDQQGLETAC